jgi:hypothetical protein
MTQTVTLDGGKLKAIGHASHTAEVTITALALRERLRHFSDITRTRMQLVRNGERIVEEDYMKFWKSLEDAGVGVIVYGRKGKPDRFHWYYSLKKVAKAAIEGTNEEVEKVNVASKTKAKNFIRPQKKAAKSNGSAKLSREEKEDKIEQSEVVPAASGRSLYIPLRPDFDLEIPVPPKGFSGDEVEVIGRALRRHLSA